MEVIWQSEIDPYASKVLAKHWPKVPNYGNIKEINWGDVVRPDVICGGYPCQPFSTAGNETAQTTHDTYGLGSEKPLANLRPKYAILENVRGHSLWDLTLLGKLPASGMTQNGKLFPQPQCGRHIEETESLSWPTPRVTGQWKGM
jgi:DNA (cytosine-5)-methyltransferase 1